MLEQAKSDGTSAEMVLDQVGSDGSLSPNPSHLMSGHVMIFPRSGLRGRFF